MYTKFSQQCDRNSVCKFVPTYKNRSEVHNPKTQKRKTFGGLFHTRAAAESKPPKEDMSHLPPHMRKRALQKMQKEAEKDVEKVEKELAAVNKV